MAAWNETATKRLPGKEAPKEGSTTIQTHVIGPGETPGPLCCLGRPDGRSAGTAGRARCGRTGGNGADLRSLTRAGTVGVIVALVGRQVDALVMNADFAVPGWIDYSLDIAGTGDIPSEHPGGGNVANIVAVDLGEEMIRKALLSDVRIEIVEALPASDAEMTLGGADQSRAEAARRLDPLGGVAATLRFSVLPDGSGA